MIKFLKRTIFFILMILILIGSYFTYQGYKLYEMALNETSVKEKVRQIQIEKENYTKIEDLPRDYVTAVVAVEDKRFYSHKGIDFISICRAIVANIKEMKFIEGGSTITQQLAKNIYFTQRKEITRKIAETFMAFEIEKNCTKDEIFELYVNTSYFGDGYYCIGDASLGYFDKLPKDLDMYESTLLAGVPNAPSVYAPTKNPELAKQRQAQVLRKMVKYQYITQRQADEILNEEREIK